MTKQRIIVISGRNDAHIPFVQRHLQSPLFCVDPLSLLEQNEISFALHGDKLVLRYGDEILDDVKSVWYRKPGDVSRDKLPVKGEFKDYSLDATQSHLSMLVDAFPGALWLSDYYAIMRAESKALQLQVAKDLGFKIPDTLITSDPKRAREFVRSQDECIVKTQSQVAVMVGGKPHSFFATRVSKEAKPDFSNLHLAPSIFQQCIDTAYDVRIAVVGDKFFAARIQNEGLEESNIRDWRVGNFKGKLLVEHLKELPSEVGDRCVKLVKAFGLNFGVIDMVADNNGEFWFLENNPNGQWAFMEHLADIPIGKAIANMLEKGK